MKLLYEKEIITEKKKKPGGAPTAAKTSPPPLPEERAFDTNQVDWPYKAFSLQAKSVPPIQCVS